MKCFCCEGLFFNHSVQSYNINKKKVSKSYLQKIYNYNSSYVCSNCLKVIKQSKIPKLATSNGLKYEILPKSVTMLSELEQRFVSHYICFMQIKPKLMYQKHAQLGMK